MKIIARELLCIARELYGHRGLQLRRKDSDTIRDTGGVSKGRDKEPEVRAPRDDVRKPWRTKNKPAPEREKDTDGDTDKDMKLAGVFSSFAAQMLSKFPKRFVEAVNRVRI